MLKQKTILVCTASCLNLLIGYSARADIPPALSFISSQSDNSSLTLPNSLGREKVKTNLSDSNSSYLSSSGLTRVSRSEKAADSFNLDPRIKSEDDTSLVTSPLRGEVGLRSRTGEGDNKNIQLAAACFVTDTTNCSGNEFGGNNADEDDGGVPPGGDDYDLDNAERCRQEGYNQTSCPEGQEPSNFCPYDSNYFEKCVSSCPSNYVTCEDGFQGVGEACDGKYASCCNTCEGFDYVTIPDGYVQDGAFCSGCDGIKYKVKCDPSQYTQCTSGGTGTCTDDYGTYYKECDCPANYEWDNVSKSCVCSTIYKYNCVGEHITGGDGQSCDNQYAGCKCETGYVWDDAQGKCVSTCQGIDWCTLTPDCAALGYAQQSCTGKSVKCPFNTSFSYCLD